MAGRVKTANGYVKAVNVQAGTVTVPDGSTSASVTFDEAMENTPTVVVTVKDSGESAFVSAESETGFTVDGLTSAGANDVNWFAMDYQQHI